MVGPPGWLSSEERDLLLHVATLREKAIAFNISQLGHRKLSYGPPTLIPTVPHQPWQDKPFLLPQEKRAAVIDLIRDQLKQGLMEPSPAKRPTLPIGSSLSRSRGRSGSSLMRKR